MRQDGRVGENRTARRVIEVAMGIDDGARRLAGLGERSIAKRARQPRILLGVDDDKAVRRFDRAGIGIAAGADPRMDALGDGDEMGFAFVFGHARRFDNRERSCRHRRAAVTASCGRNCRNARNSQNGGDLARAQSVFSSSVGLKVGGTRSSPSSK